MNTSLQSGAYCDPGENRAWHPPANENSKQRGAWHPLLTT